MKKLFAVILSLLTIATLTACKSDTTSGNENTTDTPAVTVEETTVETTTAPDVTVAPKETTAETEVTTAETEATTTISETATTDAPVTTAATKAETTTSAANASNIIIVNGDGYSISVDNSKWMDISVYMGTISQKAEEMDKSGQVKAEQIQNAKMYYHIIEPTVNFSVMSQKNDGTQENIDLSTMSEILSQVMKAKYEKAGFTYEGDKLIKVNGYDCFKMSVSADEELAGVPMKMSIYCFFIGDYQYVVSYTAASSTYNTYFADFEKSLNSITFTK